MNSDEYKLKIIVTYNGKSFNKESMNVISLEEIKNLSIENFKLSKEDINFMKFSCLNNKESNCFIESDIDIFNNISKKDSENYEIKLKLSIDKSDLNITKKISDNMLEIINDYEKDGEISINFSKIKDVKEKDESYKKIIKIFRDECNKYKEKYSVLKLKIKKLEEEKKKERINRVIINDEFLEKIIKTNKIIENIEKYKKFENDCLFLNKKFEEKYKNLENEALKIKKNILENNEKLKQLEFENSKLKQENEELNKINQNMLQNILSENRENFQNLKNENIEIKNYFEKELKNNNNEIISQIKTFVKNQMESIIKEEFKKAEEIRKKNNVDKNIESILNKQNNDIFKELTIIKDIIEHNNKKEISINHSEKNANININKYNSENNLLNNNSEKEEESNNFNDNTINKITKNISNINNINNVNTNINNNNNISKIKSNCINNDNNKGNNALNNNTCEKYIEINNDVINEKNIINQTVEKSKINTLEKTGETEENDIDHQFKLNDNNNMNDGGSKIIINNNSTKLNSDNFSVLDNNIYNSNKGNNDKKEDNKKINSINNDNNDNNDKENSENLLNEMKSIFNSELKYYSDEEIINALNNNKNNIRLALTELMIINPKNLKNDG